MAEIGAVNIVYKPFTIYFIYILILYIYNTNCASMIAMMVGYQILRDKRYTGHFFLIGLNNIGFLKD